MESSPLMKPPLVVHNCPRGDARIRSSVGIRAVDTSGHVTSNQFFGRVHGNAVSFELGNFYCPSDVNCVIEQLADNRYLSLAGTAQAIVTTPAEISAVFAGAVSVTGDANRSQPIAACAAPDHQLVFKRTVGTSDLLGVFRTS
jgi:hypothetical protein